MKKMFLMAGLLVSSFATFANESFTNDGTILLAQYNNEQVVRAYYVSNGRLVSIKIKISGGRVVAYSTGKDMAYRESWVSVLPANIRSTNSTTDGNMAREFDYTATLSTGSFSGGITVYF